MLVSPRILAGVSPMKRSKQGGDPDEARRARGEAEFLTSRALRLAPNNDEVKKLREEVIKLLQVQEECTNGRN